jgi:RNA-directed DNA polymerase
MWSPQLYIEAGKAHGIKESVLDNAVDQIERVIIENPDLPAILSLNHLAQRAQVDYDTLRSIAARKHNPYRHFYIRKRSGGHRRISIPGPELMQVQRWLAKYVLNPLPVHHCSFAFKPGSSIVKCAARHTGARWLVKMDIAGFFTSISEIQAYRVFESLGYQPLVALELARLTTYTPLNSPRYELPQWRARASDTSITDYRFKGLGYLPQGAPTSPMLSNLAMPKIDALIEQVAKAFGLRYTRYSDDLTFSTRSDDFNRGKAANLIGKVTRILVPVGLRPQHRKTVVVPPGARKVVLGLLVDGERPRLSREFRSDLRQHIYYLEKFGPVEHAKTRQFDTVFGMYNHIRGLIDFARMVDREYGDAMFERLQAVEWPFLAS